MGVLFPKINDESRVLELNRKEHRLRGNKIDTAKYSVFTFLPKSLLLQFTRLSNIVFLANAILQSIPIISTISPLTAIGPLAFVLSLSMLRQGYEDYVPQIFTQKRHKKDWEINSRKTQVLKEGEFHVVEWDQVRPGDFLKILNGEVVPADILLLASSSEAGICYVETANLDGESNLKEKRTVAEVAHLTTAQLEALRGSVTAERPSPNLYEFSGKAQLQGRPTIYLEFSSLLLRETVVRNTEQAVGLAIYCGHDSKILRNQGNIHHKMSNIEHQVNYIQIALVVLLVLLCTASSIGYTIIHQKYSLRNNNSYVPQTGFTLPVQSTLMFFTIFLLLNFLIPITLNILIEGIKTFSAVFLSLDKRLYDRILKRHCGVLNSSIVEQLGLVDCVLTDKTGTLTANEMVFRALAIEGRVYLRNHIESNVHDLSQDAKFHQLVLAMAVCHDVVRDSKREEYQGSSPDEVCFVEFAHSIGYSFESRARHTATLELLGLPKKLELLEIVPFSSRKRMSVVVRDPNNKNKVTLFTKGADSAIFEKAHWYADSEAFNNNIDAFAKDGLRTLVFARKELSVKELRGYLTTKEKIKWELRQRIISKEDAEEREKELIEALQSSLQIIGATGIQDRLQDDVPQTLARLQHADIRVMMITGDKLETAQNIGYLSQLIREDYRVFKISTDIQDVPKYCQYIKKQILNGEPFTLIVEGRQIGEIVQPNHPSMSLYASLLAQAKSVIFCRSSPKEKAVIVRFVKEQLGLTVLAIGDGGNDVGMIEEAHVGIGIIGKEGNSAAAVSDFSIGQFKFLDRLVLHHGRWFYYRLSYFFVFFGLKNMAITVIIFLYLLDCAFSGSLIFTQLFYLLYNCFIGVSMLVNYGLFDQDANDDLQPALWRHLPRLYSETKRRELFSYWRYVVWSIAAIVMAIFMYYVIRLSLLNVANGEDGNVPDILTAKIANGIALNFVILTLNYIDTESHTSFFTYFVLTSASLLPTVAYFIAENYMAILDVTFSYTDNFNLRFWLTIFLVVAMIYTCKMGYHYFMVQFYPTTLELYKQAKVQDEQRKEEIFNCLLAERDKGSKYKQEVVDLKARNWTSNVHNTTDVIYNYKQYRSAAINYHITEQSLHQYSQ